MKKNKNNWLLWPNLWVSFAVLFTFSVAALVLREYILAASELVVSALVVTYYTYMRNRRRKEMHLYAKKLMRDHEHVSGTEAPFPTVLVRLGDDAIVWANDEFSAMTDYEDRYLEQSLSSVLSGCSTEWLHAGRTEAPYDFSWRGRRYRIYGYTVRTEEPEETVLGILYFTDLTELYQVRDEYIRSRPVVGVILIDNYDEMIKDMTEVAISGLNAQINNIITEWTDQYHGLLRSLDRNRFLFLFEKRDLIQATQNKFPILEEIHRVENPSGLEASISFGIGVDGVNFEENYRFAALSIEMALSRGGDQAVVKDRLDFSFYGGRSKEADHRSKVRSRITANSLMELFQQSSQVFIMGHRNADMDAVGAAMGISCLARKAGKKARIVIDLEHNMSEALLAEIFEVPEYAEMFISGEQAMLECDNRSTLVVVDTNRPDQVEYRALLEAVPRICVVDHHRRAADYIDPVVVNLHEPFASSASELTAELLQYAVEKHDVYPIEAKAMLAGIFLDTKSFNIRTGERTFEAAALLRQWGADTVEVKRLLQSDFQDTMAKYHIIKCARLYRQEIAIAALNTTTPRALAAQAADELLNISGITASFVLYPDGDTVYISGRSIGNVNVQLVLEPLGGGGNTAGAGAQVKNSDVREVLDRLVASIDSFYEQ